MKRNHHRQAGFSLVELMVSVVIGLLALVFAVRLLATSEQNKQESVGGSDSMQNGMQALFTIGEDAAQAGWGLNDSLIGGCDTNFYDAHGYTLPTATRSGFGSIRPLSAVVIESNGTKPDKLTLMSGSSVGGTGSLGLSVDYASGSVLKVDRLAFAFRKGDAIAVVPEASNGVTIKCSVAQLSDDPGFDAGVQILRTAAAADAPLNNPSGLPQAYEANVTRIFNLGPASSLKFHTWSVEKSFLMMQASDLVAAAKKPQNVVGNVVSLKAQYGFDDRPGIAGEIYNPAGGLAVTKWSNTMMDADGDTISGGPGDYARIASIRLAVVARSKAAERPKSGVCKSTQNAVQVFTEKHTGTLAAAPITLDVAVPGETLSWNCYHYRVFESIIPLRNLAWRPTA